MSNRRKRILKQSETSYDTDDLHDTRPATAGDAPNAADDAAEPLKNADEKIEIYDLGRKKHIRESLQQHLEYRRLFSDKIGIVNEEQACYSLTDNILYFSCPHDIEKEQNWSSFVHRLTQNNIPDESFVGEKARDVPFHPLLDLVPACLRLYGIASLIMSYWDIPYARWLESAITECFPQIEQSMWSLILGYLKVGNPNFPIIMFQHQPNLDYDTTTRLFDAHVMYRYMSTSKQEFLLPFEHILQKANVLKGGRTWIGYNHWMILDRIPNQYTKNNAEYQLIAKHGRHYSVGFVQQFYIYDTLQILTRNSTDWIFFSYAALCALLMNPRRLQHFDDYYFPFAINASALRACREFIFNKTDMNRWHVVIRSLAQDPNKQLYIWNSKQNSLLSFAHLMKNQHVPGWTSS